MENLVINREKFLAITSYNYKIISKGLWCRLEDVVIVTKLLHTAQSLPTS